MEQKERRRQFVDKHRTEKAANTSEQGLVVVNTQAAQVYGMGVGGWCGHNHKFLVCWRVKDWGWLPKSVYFVSCFFLCFDADLYCLLLCAMCGSVNKRLWGEIVKICVSM